MCGIKGCIEKPFPPLSLCVLKRDANVSTAHANAARCFLLECSCVLMCFVGGGQWGPMSQLLMLALCVHGGVMDLHASAGAAPLVRGIFV